MTQELFDRSARVTPGGVHSPVRSFKGVGGAPVFFKKAQGATLSDVDGNDYIDFCQSFGPLILGHRDPDVEIEVHNAVGDVWTLGTADPYSLELAEWIVKKIDVVERIRFVNSGTEAVMSALRLARGFTGRTKIVKFDGCYHGHVDSMLVKAGSGLAGGQSASSSAGVSENQAGDTLVLPLGDEVALKALFEREGDHIAAIIVEPLPANFGLLPLTNSFLETLRSLSKAHGALLIFDEVISGFRVALGGMAQVSNITPDLVTYGKVIGGGFPVGAFAGRAEIMDFIAPEGPVYQAGTLSANPISMRAGLVTLKKAAQPGNYELLNQRTDRFANALEGLIAKTGVDIKLVHSGSLLWMCPGAKDMDIHGPEDFPADLQSRFKPFFLSLLEQGIYVAPSGYEVMFLSHAHTDEVLEEALKKFERAFESFRK